MWRGCSAERQTWAVSPLSTPHSLAHPLLQPADRTLPGSYWNLDASHVSGLTASKTQLSFL